MVGISIEIEQLEKGLTVKFVDALNDAIIRAEREITLIMDGNHSEWEIGHLRRVVIPELSELAEHAQKGEVYFKYGLHACLLYSSYLMTDSLKKLNGSYVGDGINKVQEMYWLMRNKAREQGHNDTRDDTDG